MKNLKSFDEVKHLINKDVLSKGMLENCEDCLKLWAEVSNLGIECMPLFEANQDMDYLTSCEVRIIHPFLKGLTITYRQHDKKYSINWHFSSPYINIYGREEARKEAGVIEPKNIGVLSESKVKAWVTYYEELYFAYNKKAGENKRKIEEYMVNVRKMCEVEGIELNLYGEGLNNEWKPNFRGWFNRGGIEFNFEVDKTSGYVYEKISIGSFSGTALEKFLLLSDNGVLKLSKEKEAENG